MSFDYEEEYILFELEYKASTEGITKIFGDHFVNKNKDKCKIILNNQEYNITEYFEDIDNNHNDSIKFQLRINNNITDISFMFYECEMLLSIRYITELDDSDNININKIFAKYNSNISSEKSGTQKSEIFYPDNSIPSSIQNKYNENYFFSIQSLCNITNMINMFHGFLFINNIT